MFGVADACPGDEGGAWHGGQFREPARRECVSWYRPARDWFRHNIRSMQALTDKGCEVKHAPTMNEHGRKMGGVVMFETVRWLWRGGETVPRPCKSGL